MINLLKKNTTVGANNIHVNGKENCVVVTLRDSELLVMKDRWSNVMPPNNSIDMGRVMTCWYVDKHMVHSFILIPYYPGEHMKITNMSRVSEFYILINYIYAITPQ
jgi:hypothetical protein